MGLFNGVNIGNNWEYANDGMYSITLHTPTGVVFAQKMFLCFHICSYENVLTKEETVKLKELLKYGRIHDAYLYVVVLSKNIL